MNPLAYVKMGLGVVALIAIGFAYFHYEHLKSLAAEVPALKQQVTDLTAARAKDDADAQKAALQIVANMAAEKQSLLDFDKWSSFRTNLSNDLKGLVKNAKATKNPDCLPTVDERSMWNSTIQKLATP